MSEEFRSRGARALVRLHEIEMRKLWEVWREARRRGIALPATDDTDYADLDTLMRHPLRAARGYLTWFCEKTERPDPGIPPAPEAAEIDARGEEYLETVLAAWRRVLAGTSDAEMDSRTPHLSRWKAPYILESMLEHAVVHPMRHRIQLEELMEPGKA
ncbi:MAG: hypothetical protein GF346_02615 [Candidatus Eisenbacteria bacterium]|nr:hypothetical protein [Candidatus Latescibacterota bacterium]MBD3301313.1 hypothetical protein [Candidatus Eisenbacteria bacterium]